MAKDIRKKDFRLFLFRSLEYGLNHNLIDETFLKKLQTEGTELSFGFAKRYYSVIYEAYLRQASHCVLGTINLGLTLLAAPSLDKAVYLLKTKSYVGVFREGWTRIIEIAELSKGVEESYTKTDFELEVDFAELFSAEPGKIWIGKGEYYYNLLKADT